MMLPVRVLDRRINGGAASVRPALNASSISQNSWMFHRDFLLALSDDCYRPSGDKSRQKRKEEEKGAALDHQNSCRTQLT
jgi:hypothetical protein